MPQNPKHEVHRRQTKTNFNKKSEQQQQGVSKENELQKQGGTPMSKTPRGVTSQRPTHGELSTFVVGKSLLEHVAEILEV